MFIECSRYDLTNEIPLGSHNLLQAGPHPAAGVDRLLPVEVGEHLHDRVDEGLLSDMRGPVSVPLSHAAHKKVKVIQIWRPYIPQGLQNFIRFFYYRGHFDITLEKGAPVVL